MKSEKISFLTAILSSEEEALVKGVYRDITLDKIKKALKTNNFEEKDVLIVLEHEQLIEGDGVDLISDEDLLNDFVNNDFLLSLKGRDDIKTYFLGFIIHEISI